mmetsp:Transcript_216/g.392  ORF Transcript_216/g.392 Transcript_216/m.392 type:complete len:732 (+) Transcript_216:22-2217(+)
MNLDCEGWTKIVEIFPEMDFSKELEEKPELSKYLRGSINQLSTLVEPPLSLKEAPELDSDFSKYIVINGLPLCDEKKAQKLIMLIIKLFGKKKFNVSEENIVFNYSEKEGVKQTTGQAFIKLDTEEKAKIAAVQFNGYQLDKKHTFSVCTFNDFDKIMEIGQDKEEEALTRDSKTSYLELNAQTMETRLTPYAFQLGKNVYIKNLQGQSKILHTLEEHERPKELEPLQSDQTFSWSPRGTYLVVIRSDKVEFVGGSKMTPILTINEPKVESITFSPCERYLLVYCPKNDLPYSVWNFQTHEKIREFEQFRGENAQTFRWSFQGDYIAKIVRKSTKKEGEEENEEDEENQKTYIAVYELPSMKMIEDSDNNRTSIFVDGLREFTWAPNANVIVHTSFPIVSENALPRITFLGVPSRRNLHMHTHKDSQNFEMTFHPDGSYLAVMNEFTLKKQTKFSVEIFETKDLTRLQPQIPHQQILIEKEVVKFHGVSWEPSKDKIAVLTTSKKVLEAGQKQFSNDPNKSSVDIYQIKNDPMLGLILKNIGSMAADKVLEVHFSSAGNILCTIDQEGPSRTSLNFYMIQRISNEGQTTTAKFQPAMRGRVVDPKHVKDKKIAAVEDTYEFRKMAKHEVKDKRFVAKWNENGRFFVVQGRKMLSIDKQPKTIRIYNMFGELIEQHVDLLGLENFQFRPRPLDILKPDQVKKLKKTYKSDYEKVFKEEELKEREAQSNVVKD